jgi:hypothetical protein
MTVSEVNKLNTILHKGDSYYRNNLKDTLEQTHQGEYVLIDVDSCNYWIDTNKNEVLRKARKESNVETFFSVQIGV